MFVPPLTQRQNIDPGLLLGISLAEACTRELLVVTRRLMDASMPQRSQRCGHLVYENIFHPCNRTSLATWLLRHASLVIEEHYDLLQLKSRRSFMAVVALYPSKSRSQQFQRWKTPDTWCGGLGIDKNGHSKKVSIHKASLRAHCQEKQRCVRKLRVQKARVQLIQQRGTGTTISPLSAFREWGAMSYEERNPWNAKYTLNL